MAVINPTTNILVILLGLLLAGSAAAQTDTAGYKKRQLQGAEVDFLFSYYEQDGNNGAVMGGVGSEKLTDVTPTIIVNLPWKGDSTINNLNLDFGMDVYTSASSDSVDPNTVSSASSGDTRVHLNGAWSHTDERTGTTWGVNGGFSFEYDYNSLGMGVSYSKSSKNNMREFGFSGQAFFDTWQVIRPVEVSGRTDIPGVDGGRNTFSLTSHYSQIVNKRLQWALISDIVYQNGLLSTPFHRVYFADAERVNVETLPGTKLKLPLGFRANYFIGDFLILRSYYRYYWDDWGLTAHTAQIEAPVKITPFFSVYPIYRYYTQTAADYFAPFRENLSTQEFFTSDYDLSAFDSHYYGLGLRYAPVDGIMRFTNPISRKKRKIHSVGLRYGIYDRSTGLNASIVSFHLKMTDL